MRTFEQLESEDTPNIYSMLEEDEREVRLALLPCFIDSSGPVVLPRLTTKLKKVDIDVPVVIKRLEEKGLIVMQGGAISGLYPYSAIPTKHKVQLHDGSSVYAMCAIDSLGVAYELDQDVKISSSCAFCDEVLEVEVVGGEVSHCSPMSSRAIHVSLSEYKNWAASC